MATGKFIVFEGGEGNGKTTQARLLAECLGALLTHEPGGTPLGLAIRQMCLNAPDVPADRAMTMLMLADRAQHVTELILPTLHTGRHVVCDRFSGSTIAYQGYGDQLGCRDIQSMSRWAASQLEPDLVLYLYVPPEQVQVRMQHKHLDNIERRGPDYHARVQAGFEAQAATNTSWVTMDGTGTPRQVHERILTVVSERLELGLVAR